MDKQRYLTNIIQLFTIVLKVAYYITIIFHYPYLVIRWCFSWLKYLDPRFLYCRVFHGKSTGSKYWELAPFGMGGGHYSYSLKCSGCNKKHWDITEKQYKKIGE